MWKPCHWTSQLKLPLRMFVEFIYFLNLKNLQRLFPRLSRKKEDWTYSLIMRAFLCMDQRSIFLWNVVDKSMVVFSFELDSTIRDERLWNHCMYPGSSSNHGEAR